MLAALGGDRPSFVAKRSDIRAATAVAGAGRDPETLAPAAPRTLLLSRRGRRCDNANASMRPTWYGLGDDEGKLCQWRSIARGHSEQKASSGALGAGVEGFGEKQLFLK